MVRKVKRNENSRRTMFEQSVGPFRPPTAKISKTDRVDFCFDIELNLNKQ